MVDISIMLVFLEMANPPYKRRGGLTLRGLLCGMWHVVKDDSVDISDSTNYCTITLSNLPSQLFEHSVLINSLSDWFPIIASVRQGVT